MYIPGARFVVKIKIKMGDMEYEPDLKGKILSSVDKMVGKAYRVEFDDGRTAELHIVTMNNQTRIITPDGEEIDIRELYKKK
ncbi:MAG TPA: hypothetical protein VGA94_01070 [Thermodesulfobacteriota bacterium]|jgi:hypothetical protein